VCIICVSIIDASVAGELPEEGHYQEEEEEEVYLGHLANQGKPSFDSYPNTKISKFAYLIVFKLNCMIELLE
jgi:hypothetical protein